VKRKPNKVAIAAIAVVHVAVMTLTWRDLRNRPPAGVRGNKKAWRVASAVNTGGSAAYWIFGRRRAS
jgi:hypothetical protein